MSNTAHLLYFFVVFLLFKEVPGYFPKLIDLAKGSPINSSSTCGQTRTKYCDSSTLGAKICTQKDCHFDCCSTCSNSAPKSYNLEIPRSTLVGIFRGEPRPGKTNNSLGFDSRNDSKIVVRPLPTIDYKRKGFTISVWLNQSRGNTGTVFSKSFENNSSLIYGIVLNDFTVTLYYIPEGSNQTENIQIKPLASQYPRHPLGWHFIVVMVYRTELSYFLDGNYVGTQALKNAIKDRPGTQAIVGQIYPGNKKYDGLMEDIFFYPKALTNREITEIYTGIFPSTYIAPECRCPPSHPKISTRFPAKCTKNFDTKVSNLVSRLSDTSHPIEFATDDDSVSYWLSKITDKVTIDINLLYQPLQVFYVTISFYGPLPQAILIEKSYDHGRTYHDWQYFAQDCVKSFGMLNNGVIKEPNSVNCIQYASPIKNVDATITFRTDNPGIENVPLRPYGPGCNNLYCSPKLLDFVRATNVRIHFFNHTLVKEREAKYFGLSRLLVSGRCECYGHAEVVDYISGNVTHNGSCVCKCHPSSNTESNQCNRCKPLYNNKAYRRGTGIFNSFPCVKCQCNNHANSCYYNQTLDPAPDDRTGDGGGVCTSCLHNTAGRHCEVCKEKFFREPGRSLNDPDVCTACGCVGPGVKPGAQDCAKDNSNPSVLPGQCECKDNVTGRLCDQCKPGYYDLKSSHETGCISCNCNTRGTNNSDVTCDVTTGQCNCKANVIGRRCDQCKAMFYNLSGGNPHGCQPCLCNLTGSTSMECDKVSGQCPCKTTVTGRQCERCEVGFHTLNTSGCQPCKCDSIGTRLGALKRCNPVSGNCQCKNYVSGYSCDRCISGYYNLRRDNVNGCTRCSCDSKGTVGNNKDCHANTGVCTCKSNVTGANCDHCPAGYFNLSSSNPNGCQPCQCNRKGTKLGDQPGELDCHLTSGECLCLSNVNGEKCDQCAVGYVWDQKGQGCIRCNCDHDGSLSANCNDTGFCDCKTGNGIGGQFCSECLLGYFGFTKGRCSPCHCNKAGIKKDGCDAVGCFHCKENVRGSKCDRCKPGTKSLKQENPFGCSGVPSQQGPPFVQKVYSRTLWIAWDPPDTPNGLITNYELYRNGSRVYNNVSHGFNDTGLQPYTWYTYYLITRTDGGSVRSLADGSVYRTAQDAPSGVAQPNFTEISSRSTKTYWSYPAASNGIIRNFSLVSTNKREPNPVVHCHGLFLNCDVTRLRPYTVYNFTVRACTDVGCTSSEAKSILTRPTAPDSQPAPVVIPVPGGKKFSVYWDEPAEPNGWIFRYELHQRSSPFQGPGRQVFSVSPSVSASQANLRNTTITGLVPFSEYEFRVVTFTAQVSGHTSSNWTRQRTAEAAPKGENDIRPQSYAISSSEVNISWSLPSAANGKIIKSNIYLYTNETSYLIPTLVHTVNRSSSGVVSGLEPYSRYQFTVTSCNSVGCTNHSTRTEARTWAAAPTGQAAPSGRQLNSTHISLTWHLPSRPNGPVPPVYHVFRSPAAFHYPPINAIDGAHFPGLGYYRLSNTVIRAGIRTNIELYFKTRYSDGLVVFLASSGEQDFLAVELRDGIPWFIFNCQDGVAQITSVNSTKFNDEQWHHLKISRNRRMGSISVDNTYRGEGSSSGTATVIDDNTGVYVGGLSSQFVPEKNIQDFIPSIKKRIHFIGCLKGLRLQNKVVSFNDAIEKLKVDPLSSGCPLNADRGVYLKGGGYLSLKKGIFKPGKIYHLSFNFKTHYSSGLLVFIYGENESYLTVVLDSGDIQIFYRTNCCHGNFTVSPSRSVCDGRWHKIDLTNFGSESFAFKIDGKTTTHATKVLQVSSELYFGGVPPSSQASDKLKKIGIKTTSSFGGCFKNIAISSHKINLLTDVAAARNADLSGCPKYRPLTNFTAETCRNLSSTLVYSGRHETTVDTNLAPFTDYLYQVESKQPGSKGGAKSPWFAVRSSEGAPEYQKPPHNTTAFNGGRSIFVSWLPPVIYNGILRGYILQAYSVRNSSLSPVQKTINDPDVHDATFAGLDPYTLYDVTVVAFTNGGRGESAGAMVTTLESVPEDVPSPDVHRQPHWLFISWQRPFKQNGIITNYSLNFDGVIVYHGLNVTFNRTGLRVFSRHTLQLTACTKVGCANSDTKTVYTAEIPPENIAAPDVTIRDAHSAEVRWEKPGSENGIMRGYQVLVAKNTSHADVAVVNASSEQFDVIVMNLTAGTWYVFRINAINGGGATRSPPTTRRTVESSPEGIPPPDVRGLSPYSILATIQEPRLPNGHIIRYELFEVVGLNEIVVLNGSLRNYTKTGLLPYTAHRFRSKVCTAKGCGSSGIGTGFTLEIAPNGTVLLNVAILNSTSVSASWTIIDTPNGKVSYDLVVHGEFLVEGSSSFETEITSRVVASVYHPADKVLFTSFLPYTLFRFQVNASNSAGFVLSNVVNNMTKEGAPVGLTSPNVTILNSTAAHVTWSPPARDNGILLYYEIMRINLESNISKISNNSLDLYVVMTDLEPYNTYQFQVAAITRGGRSWSPETVVTTSEDIPSPIDPPTISKVDSRSLVVKWNYPTTPNGVITRYIIYRNVFHVTTVSVNKTMLTVTELEPFTIYTFSVAVCTMIGCSNSSLSRPVRTLEDVPKGQSSPELLHAAGPSVLIRWSAPTVTNGMISEYSIQRGAQLDLSNITVVASIAVNLSTEYRDRTVKPCSKYYYRVIAFTKKGGGTPSPWSNITTQEGAPDFVPAPTTRTVNSTAVHVAWSAATSQCNITEYIIRVLRKTNYTGFGSFGPRSFTVGDLLPYQDYGIVVAACTSTACRDSAPSIVRTATSLPRDQPPPSATPLDSRSLRVIWSPPRVPAGRILSYRLYRKTLDEPVPGNLTTPYHYVLIYQGNGERFDDKGMMSIFSLQQYKVTVTNTEGNTTSDDSLPYRTGPASPLAGVFLSGLPINHTSILLNWTLPQLKLLRGNVKTYEVHYTDLSNNIEYTFVNDLNGTARSVVVSHLKPSRDYTLKVILNNGAGTFSSNDVRVRTLDGAPEGFDKPNVRTIDSTIIEVRWTPPKTPNGKITVYIVYANGAQMGNTSLLELNVTSLIPYTDYAIQVEVCTVYTCTRSGSNNAKTLSAVPEQLDPPRLIPGPRNMMVIWGPPRRPNGEMLEYKLFQSRLQLCPTSPPPVTYCTYIECPIAEQLCGSTCYNPKNKICCNGALYNRDPKKTCCDKEYLTKTSPDDVCCSGRFHSKSSNYMCCHGYYKLVNQGQVCCKNSRGSVEVGVGNACCDGTPYDNSTKYCVCGALYNDASRHCCGGRVTSRAQICCGGTESDGRAYDKDLQRKKCCGTEYVPISSLCCKSKLGTWKVYNYSSIAERDSSGDQCCETNKITVGLSCCNGQGYNASTQVCADRATSLSKTGCGTGTICNKSFETSALCNKCDFNQRVSFCNYISGYYSTVKPTPPSNNCSSGFKEIASGNHQFLSYNDTKLHPYTTYEYYLFARNTEGNVTSSKSRNTTLMDAPEDLVPPSLTVLSEHSIEIRYTQPATPNGIISAYKVHRNDQNKTTETLVYEGLDLSYVDSGLEPYTIYFYILEVCTRICSNVSSKDVSTKEGTPENVYPPSLISLTSRSIEIKWRRPGKPNGVIIEYHIERVNSTNHTKWFRNSSEMVLVDNSTDLRPYTNYTYTVTACTKIGCSTSSRGFVTTLEAAPEGLRAPDFLPRDARTVEVFWVAPGTPNGKIIGYTLYRGDNLIYRTNERCLKICWYTDRGLSPHTWYNYSIEASTNGGSTRSNIGRVQTPESSPEGIPAPTLRALSSSSVLVNWTQPSIPNGKIDNYTVIVDTKNNYPAGSAMQLTVTNLEPFTFYSFQIQACTIKGCGVGNRTEVRTLEAPPEGQPAPTLVALSDAVVRITWGPPKVPNGDITSYEVERKLMSSVPIVVFKTTRTNDRRWQTLNSGLLPYRNYSYRIRAINSAGSNRSPWAIVRTLEGAPSGVFAPVVHVLNATAVTASWQRPRESNGRITRYELWSRELDNPRNKISVASSRNPEQNVTVGGLKPNTNYEFQLVARTNHGVGYSQWALAETLEAPPSDLRYFTARKHVNGRELTLTWGEPSQPNGVITDYKIYSDGVKVFSGISKECHLVRLQPFTAYTFQLEACTSAGCTRGLPQVITTAEIPPRRQQAPTFATINSTFVTITWRPPALPHGIILFYQVLRLDSPSAIYETNGTNKTMFTYMDTSLQPFTKYEYKIQANNSAGSTDSPTSTVTTAQAPPSFVKAPVLTPQGSSSVDVSWSSPERANGIVISYTLRRNHTVVGHWVSKFSFRDTLLNPSAAYGYWLTVCTGGGCTDSAEAIVKTGESRPGAVNAPTLMVLSSLAIEVGWQPPLVANGRVIRYVLYMNKEQKYSGDKLSHLVSNLLPFTTYTFYVSACTSSGCTAGDSSSAKTHEAAPDDLDVPSYSVLGPSALEIKWSPPRKPNGIIIYYLLKRNRTIMYNGTDLRYNDLKILPYSYYKYVVTAVNTAGRKDSPVLYTNRTSPGTPENVRAPILTPLSGSEIRLTWLAPEKPNGIITKYSVLYNNIEVNVGRNMSYVAKNLVPYTQYSFRVRACTKIPPCADSAENRTRTLEGRPRGLRAPVIPSNEIEARSVFVAWRPPSSPNGVIIRYVLHRREVVKEILGNTVTMVYEGPLLNFTDITVVPFQQYGYQLVCVNSKDKAQSEWVIVTTKSAPPEDVPVPHVLEVTPSSLSITIDPPGKLNGVITHYKVEVNGKNVSNGTSRNREVDNLEPYVVYSLRVFACTVEGCTPSKAVTQRTGTGAPGQVKQPTFGEVTSTSIFVNWKPPEKPNGVVIRYFVVYKYVCSQNCVRKRAVSEKVVDVGLDTTYAITNLQPYTVYEIVIRVENKKLTTDSQPVRNRTTASDPEYIRKPVSNITGVVVLIDWSKSFRLNGPLSEYILYENEALIFRGISTDSGNLPDRTEAEFIYVVSLTTTVNGEKKTVKSIPFSVNNPGVSSRSSGQNNPWFQAIWFLVLISVFIILAVFAVVAVCLRKTSGDRTVYLRTRDPLPIRPKSRSGPLSLSSNYTPSEAQFNLGMTELNSRASTVIGENDRFDKFEDSSEWEGYIPHTDTYGNTGWFDDDKTWTDEDEPDAVRSTKYQVFLDTHL